MSNKNRTPRWISEVHAHGLATGDDFTYAMAVQRFGVPAVAATPSEMLERAVGEGLFRRRVIVVDGRRETRYYSVVPEATTSRPPNNAQSYFYGLRRVRSVFELGASQ